MKVILSIEGMTCSACSNGLEKYLNKQKGIIKASVNLVMATAYVEYQSDITIDDINKYIASAGFKSLGIAKFDEDKKDSIKPYIIYGVIAFILMYISMSHMGLPIISIISIKENPLNYSLCLTLLTIPFLFFGYDIIKSGIKNLIHKMPNMDTLIAIGIISSFLYSLYSVIMIVLNHNEFVHNLYFESTAFVIYFVKVGRFIDKKTRNKTKNAIKKLVTITPKNAKLKTGSSYVEVTIDEIKKDDELICLPGDKIAVDGIITEGSTYTDESFITGESLPVKKNIGDNVIAGSTNYDGSITYKATKIGSHSTISEIVNLVVEATNTKAPISMLADKISSYFVPFIIALAILAFIVHLMLGHNFNTSINVFVTILVVACPCALGLATPLAITVSSGKCASNGILVKNSAILEKASKVSTVVFDKTGTLTKGKLTIAKILNYSNKSTNELLSILGSLENKSTHPIGMSIMEYIKNNSIEIHECNIKAINGGIEGIINNKKYLAANRACLEEKSIKNTHLIDEENLAKEGSIIYLVEDNTILALISIKDTIRDNAKELIKELKQRNIEVVMLTGDNQITANTIAKELDIDNVIANVKPSDKAKTIKDLKEDKIVLMVGDGINDAPSLTLADIGVSLSSGTDIASEAAEVILINNNIYKIIDLLYISKKTIINIKENLFWAFIYNLCMITIATGIFTNIHVNPMIACIAMIISSLTVVLNALRLK